MRKITHVATVCAMTVCLASVSRAQILEGQAVTWANFDYVRAVASSLNKVYFATTGGIIVYDKTRDAWDEPLTGTDGLMGEIPTDLWVDQFGQKLYARTDLGLYEFNTFLARWYPINELPQIDNDTRKVSPPDFLIPQFDANYMGDGRFLDVQGRSFNITTMTRDNSGRLWTGTWGFGPAVADDVSGLTKLLPYGLLQSNVNTILPDDSLLWLSGTISGGTRTGLTAFAPEENEFFYVESGLRQGLPARDVYCMEADPNSLYVGTPDGLYVIDRGNQQVRRRIGHRQGLADDIVVSLKRFGDSLFVGTANGLNLISLNGDTVYSVFSETFAGQTVYDLDRVDSTIWIAATSGAYRYIPSRDRLFQYKDPDLVLFSAVYNIEHYGDALYLASDAGVVRLDLNTGASTPFREPGFNRNGRALAVNESIIATASNRGLTIIFFDRRKPHSRDFDTNDGLASNEVYSLLLDGDYLWVGTDEGVTRFWWNNPNRVD